MYGTHIDALGEETQIRDNKRPISWIFLEIPVNHEVKKQAFFRWKALQIRNPTQATERSH